MPLHTTSGTPVWISPLLLTEHQQAFHARPLCSRGGHGKNLSRRRTRVCFAVDSYVNLNTIDA
jgi:hypothetical protein